MDQLVNFTRLETLYENSEITVFRAATNQKQNVIIKSAKSRRPSLELLTSFRHEYQINHALNLEGLVHCQQFVDEFDTHYLIYDDLGGMPLKSYLAGKPLNPDIFLSLALEMVKCLSQLHAAKIIHKDIKPDNILVLPDSGAIKLLDLSLASQMSTETQEVVSVNKLAGSFAYMSPEQTGRMNRPIDYRSDYYSLGITFYEMLTGALPFVSLDPLEYIYFHLATEAKPASKAYTLVPEMLSKIVAKLMSKSADDRYQSTPGLIADLHRCQQEWIKQRKIDAFALGEFEVLDTLTISQKMYGREAETKNLLNAFDRVKQGELGCFMIAGYSGIGKTTLVNELQKPITSNHGVYINGKFDQLQRTTPYTAFTAAFSRLIQNWLTESEEKLKRRKENLLNALGVSGQVIIDFFPELELILGQQPEVESLSPEQAQNRFLFFFQKFIGCIASRDEPLVVFIDDLQWIDQGSLRLLEIILTTQDAHSILFIGAYRDNEVDEDHPLIKLFAQLKKYGVKIESISLGPLNIQDTMNLLSDSLKTNTSDTAQLAEVIFKKTAGNPFFTREFLKECHNQDHIQFSYANNNWDWHLDAIEQMPGSNNVIDLMLAKIYKLPMASQKTLQLGSCLGMAFDIAELTNIEDTDEMTILKNLSPPLKEGMIQRIENGLKYKFIHDRVQQAVYQTLSEDERKQLHLKAGRLLLNAVLNQDEQIFDVLDHFKRCPELIQDTREHKILADLALRAGIHAINSNAYIAAHEYLELGLFWAENLNWHEEHELHFNLNLENVNCLYLQGDYQTALDVAHKLLEKKLVKFEGAYVYRALMKINNAIGDYKSTVEMEVKGCRIIGLNLSLNPSKLEQAFEFARYYLRYRSGEKCVQTILNFKKVENTKAETDRTVLIADILFLGASASIFKGNLVFPNCATMRAARYFEKNGVDDNILYQLLDSRARIQYLFTNNLASFEILWQAGMRILRTKHFPSSIKALFTCRSTRVSGYFLKMKEMIADIEPSIQTLVETGSFTYLPWAINANFEFLCFSDVSLEELKKKSADYLKIGNSLHMQNIIDSAQFVNVCVRHLIGEEGISLKEIESALPSNQLDFSLLAAFNYYLAEEYESAKTIAQNAFKKRTYNNPSVGYQMYYALNIMIDAQLYSSESDKKPIEEEIRKNLRLLKKFSDHNPDNFLHLYLIGQAEIARIEGNVLKSMDLYHQALKQAQSQSFFRWVAISNERLGELHLELGYDGAASFYIIEAMYYFQMWGSKYKVALLEKKFDQILIQRTISSEGASHHSGFSTVMMTGELDLLTMMKANQAISSEIQIDKLLTRILGVVTESSGADKVAFVGLQGDKWFIEAQAQMNNDELIVDTKTSLLSQAANLPEGIITFTIRSGVAEVIGDMMKEERYANLPYIQEFQPKSALCLPIVRNNKTIAALYLENNLTTHAFTPDRVQLLQSLSAQIAISLENARYLEHTQELFHATERFVPKKFLQLLGRSNIEEVQIGDATKVEMSAIFADLRDFTTISESIEPEQLTYILNTYLKYMAPIIRHNNGFINRVLGDGILALFPTETQDAVQAAIQMQQALSLFNKEINDAGFNSIFMGIGVNTGPAMLCALGEEERIEANVVSDMVNAASRIEGLNKMYGTQLLISDATHNTLVDASRFCIRKIDNIKVKGKTKAMAIYEVLPAGSYEQQQQLNDYISKFDLAFNAYMKGNFKASAKLLQDCLNIKPEDSVATLFKERCEKFMQTPPQTWDGITTMLEK